MHRRHRRRLRWMEGIFIMNFEWKKIVKNGFLFFWGGGGFVVFEIYKASTECCLT